MNAIPVPEEIQENTLSILHELAELHLIHIDQSRRIVELCPFCVQWIGMEDLFDKVLDQEPAV